MDVGGEPSTLRGVQWMHPTDGCLLEHKATLHMSKSIHSIYSSKSIHSQLLPAENGGTSALDREVSTGPLLLPHLSENSNYRQTITSDTPKYAQIAHTVPRAAVTGAERWRSAQVAECGVHSTGQVENGLQVHPSPEIINIILHINTPTLLHAAIPINKTTLEIPFLSYWMFIWTKTGLHYSITTAFILFLNILTITSERRMDFYRPIHKDPETLQLFKLSEKWP